jgi:hypothetical protein
LPNFQRFRPRTRRTAHLVAGHQHEHDVVGGSGGRWHSARPSHEDAHRVAVDGGRLDNIDAHGLHGKFNCSLNANLANFNANLANFYANAKLHAKFLLPSFRPAFCPTPRRTRPPTRTPRPWRPPPSAASRRSCCCNTNNNSIRSHPPPRPPRRPSLHSQRPSSSGWNADKGWMMRECAEERDCGSERLCAAWVLEKNGLIPASHSPILQC